MASSACECGRCRKCWCHVEMCCTTANSACECRQCCNCWCDVNTWVVKASVQHSLAASEFMLQQGQLLQLSR